MNIESNKEDIDISKGQESISLVKPAILALRLAYLVSTVQKKEIFFRITRKRLEKLAVCKKMADQTSNQSNTATQDKAAITEAYIDCCRYELEQLGFILIRVDKEYLICVTEDLRKISPLSIDNNDCYLISSNEEKAEIKNFHENNKRKYTTSNKDNKKVTEDKKLILKDIWAKLVEHAKTNIHQPEQATLTYEQLTNNIQYKTYRNGLASFLYSIETFCNANSLPKLNYLVVKEGTRLPDGLKNKNYGNFIGEIKKIISSVESNKFPDSPDLQYHRKQRPKKSERLTTKETFTELND